MDDTHKGVIQPTGVAPLENGADSGDLLAALPRKLPPRPARGGARVKRPEPLRAIILARVSTKKDSQETSPDRQIARLRAECERRRWDVVEVIVEKSSGAQILNRPPVARALAKIESYDADVLAVDHLFRLGRNVREALEVVDRLEEVGGYFFDASNSLDTTGPLGRCIFTVFAAIGQLEIEDRKEKIHEGLARARERGQHLGPVRRLSDTAIARALELRAVDGTRENGAAALSWNQVREQLLEERLIDATITRGAISSAVWKLLSRKGAA
ncbi:MAG TPA: recombinase family protein [Gaiellaceae bacterium]|nr:recombinase family protein [Gaiellaceae bacterium]